MKTAILATGAIVLAALFAAGCDSSKPVPKKEEILPKSADVNSITLSPEMAQRLKIGQPAMIEIADTVQVPSQVEVEEQRLIRVGSNVTGRIVEVYVKLGDSVQAGTALARIASPELTQAQLAYLRASSLTTLAERSAVRAHQLLAADVIGLAELQRRESELQVSRAELSAAIDQLRLLGVDRGILSDIAKSGHILPSVAISVSKSGIVIERNIATGQVVQPSDELFKVADRKSVV